MKKRLIALLLVLMLAGCADTTVFIPEEGEAVEAGSVVYIPMNPEEQTEAEPATEQTEAPETEPVEKNTATVSKKPTSTSNKTNNSGNKNNMPNKETITNSTASVETQPEATEDSGGSGQITGTVPAETEPPATACPEAEPPMTEPVVTEPVATEPPATEPPATEPPLYDISDYAVSDLEYAMLDRINEYRMEADLEELWLDEYLCAIASCRSYESNLVWSHTRPDGRGYWTVLEDYGYGGGAAGELLGYSTGDAAAVVDKWMSSESHRNLLLGSSSTVGIGIYYAGGVIYVACLLIG